MEMGNHSIYLRATEANGLFMSTFDKFGMKCRDNERQLSYQACVESTNGTNNKDGMPGFKATHWKQIQSGFNFVLRGKYHKKMNLIRIY